MTNINIVIDKLLALNPEKFSRETLEAMVEAGGEDLVQRMLVNELNSSRNRMKAEISADMQAASRKAGQNVLDGVSSAELFAGRTKPEFFFAFGLKDSVEVTATEPKQIAFDLNESHAFAVRIKASAFQRRNAENMTRKGMWTAHSENVEKAAVFFNVEALEDIHSVESFSFGMDWANSAAIPNEEGYIMQMIAERSGLKKTAAAAVSSRDEIESTADEMLEAMTMLVDDKIDDLLARGQAITIEGVVTVHGVYKSLKYDKATNQRFIEVFQGKDKIRAQMTAGAFWIVNTRDAADPNFRMGSMGTFNIRGGVTGSVNRSSGTPALTVEQLFAQATSDDLGVLADLLKQVTKASVSGKISAADTAALLVAINDSRARIRAAEAPQAESKPDLSTQVGRDASTAVNRLRKGGIK